MMKGVLSRKEFEVADCEADTVQFIVEDSGLAKFPDEESKWLGMSMSLLIDGHECDKAGAKGEGAACFLV